MIFFEPPIVGEKKINAIPGYKLADLYRGIFGRDPPAHIGENDLRGVIAEECRKKHIRILPRI